MFLLGTPQFSFNIGPIPGIFKKHLSNTVNYLSGALWLYYILCRVLYSCDGSQYSQVFQHNTYLWIQTRWK